jgi:predicted RNase H-like HicB family nuclease
MLRLTRYAKAAMMHATYEQAASTQPWYGAIPGLPDLSAQAATPEACRIALDRNLQAWLRLRSALQLPIPPMDGIPLVAWGWIQQGL